MKSSKFYIKRLKFEKVAKVIKKYWEARLSLIYMIYLGIGHDQHEKSNKRLI